MGGRKKKREKKKKKQGGKTRAEEGPSVEQQKENPKKKKKRREKKGKKKKKKQPSDQIIKHQPCKSSRSKQTSLDKFFFFQSSVLTFSFFLFPWLLITTFTLAPIFLLDFAFTHSSFISKFSTHKTNAPAVWLFNS
ncbi:MAG: hypothetical protein IPI60_18150 [Saprospiraceae bacterium]|nr:hypothetical protein [Saprospiraceae bacterium]